MSEDTYYLKGSANLNGILSKIKLSWHDIFGCYIESYFFSVIQYFPLINTAQM